MHPRRAGRVYGNTPSRFHARLRAPILALALTAGCLVDPGVSSSSPATQGVWSELQSFSSTAVHMIAMPSDSGEFATQILWFRGGHKNLDYVDGGLMFFPGYDGALLSSTPSAADASVWPQYYNRPLSIPPGANIFCSSHSQLGQQQRVGIFGGTQPGAGETGTAAVRTFEPVTKTWSTPNSMAERR